MTVPTVGRRAFVAGGAALLGAVAIGCTSSGDAAAPGVVDDHGFEGTVLANPLPKPTVVFTDTEGQPFDFAVATAGELGLLFFGYTSCPDVCPIHMGVLSRALEKVRLEGGVPTVAFVGVDTARDTPEALRTFLDRFDRRFVGLTATPEQIDEALAQVRLPAVVIDPEGEGDNYPVGHPSQILAYGPDDVCHVMYSATTREQTWVNDLPRLETYDWSGA